MSAPSPAFAYHHHHNEDADDTSTARPLSGPGASRQTRRLQLRNAGFRGAALPTRKVTPEYMSSSNWSSASGIHGWSDNENVSPHSKPNSGTAAAAHQRSSSGILQEIGNSTFTRPKRSRQRVSSSAKTFTTGSSGHESACADMSTSPPPPKTTIRPRTVKNRVKVFHKRRSISGETSKYIEHLEAELATAQSQLSTLNSPTMAREQTAKMRTLNAETRQLQRELEDWESMYEQRVQEEVDKHFEIESTLRTYIRNMEQESEETKFRVHELETQLETATQSVEAVETANVNLEKRLEIMSELLAASSTRIDLHGQTPGRASRQGRPRSMLPRFPTAGSLVSPERRSRTHPTSPRFGFGNHSPTSPSSPTEQPIRLQDSPQHSDYISEAISEAESVFSETSATGDSMTSAENYDVQHNLNPWGLPSHQTCRPKPARRMRRFGAGSFGPKPLILPSTSHFEHRAPSPPPQLERRETTPAKFPLKIPSPKNSTSPLLGRRRASTFANSMALASLTGSSSQPAQKEDLTEDTMISLSPVLSAASPETTRNFSSIGPAAGKSLMDELTAACPSDSAESSRPSTRERSEPKAQSEGSYTQLGSSDVIESDFVESVEPTTLERNEPPDEGGGFYTRLQSSEISQSSPTSGTGLATQAECKLKDDPGDTSVINESTTLVPDIGKPSADSPLSGASEASNPSTNPTPTHRRTRSRSISIPIRHNISTFDRLRNLFGDLWKSPVEMARYLVQRAQAKMQLPQALVNIQWWLVGILLGPMVKRRLLNRATYLRDVERQPLLLANTSGSRDAEADRMAYGTLYSPSPPPTSSQTSSKSKDRTAPQRHCTHRRAKHSPLMWVKFSLTLAFAIGAAFKDGPASLLKNAVCSCPRRESPPPPNRTLAAEEDRRA